MSDEWKAKKAKGERGKKPKVEKAKGKS